MSLAIRTIWLNGGELNGFKVIKPYYKMEEVGDPQTASLKMFHHKSNKDDLEDF